MGKNNSLCQHGDKRMNKKLLPADWRDDAMQLSDSDRGNTKDYNPRENPFDANAIDDFEDFEEIPVSDYNGKIIGFRTELRRKKRTI